MIKGVAGGSDGRCKGLTSPRVEGQDLTLRRAYAQAGFSPATVRLFEAHGTGTAVGDATECQALAAFLGRHGAPAKSAALGSVKSMIGHHEVGRRHHGRDQGRARVAPPDPPADTARRDAQFEGRPAGWADVCEFRDPPLAS